MSYLRVYLYKDTGVKISKKQRVVELWISLPDKVRDKQTVNGFKNAYNRHRKESNQQKH